ncbi:PREDICTED: serine/threonine-protein kinase VRK1-like isoform X2 [Nicrophorus vespilloides]|uniref:non-specific serine/threonine protein kinase n=1 Tax=Nicrophorus vespilloides TaxID=110193 RepID=A0ABM1NDF2_NICVS|nr:PREDICTED: serine/threonine-protein kinase VRK1-like isoform X2 [Nicrophorus vespilloides]XP_017784852.1 PREDICTED: serine/threonine-protein kinase VRK1-like isoform X2 [Nicrophorus vespilloides]
MNYKMRKRVAECTDEYEPPKKKRSNQTEVTGKQNIRPGEILTDICGKQWKLGPSIGLGGFGEIFLVSDSIKKKVDDNCQYVAKIENHTNGPLFVEINCYLRIAKLDLIKNWMLKTGTNHLGMPFYVASGSHLVQSTKYRFLILPRYQMDLEQILQEKTKFNLKTVLLISIQILDVLQYIHSKGFIHGDIKASNILLNCSKEKEVKSSRRILRPRKNCRVVKDTNTPTDTPLRRDDNEVYLLDYGLASKYLLSNGEHKEYCVDQRKAHAGTILFCSLDAHKGIQTQRSDLECLGYNIIYWLTSNLPWNKNLEDPEKVKRKKRQCLSKLKSFLSFCFGNYPKFLCEYFQHLTKLKYNEKPNYALYKSIFLKAIQEYGYKTDSQLDFENIEGWGKMKTKMKKNLENMRYRRDFSMIQRTPLKSNLPVKPLLRKNKKNLCRMNWSRILIDPEQILKQSNKKISESSDSNHNISNLNIKKLNPTYAMTEIYNKYLERINNDGQSPKYKMESSPIDGYTSAMMQVHNNITERKYLVCSNNNSKKAKRTYKKRKSKRKQKKKSNSQKSEKGTSLRSYSLRG